MGNLSAFYECCAFIGSKIWTHTETKMREWGFSQEIFNIFKGIYEV